MYVPGLMDDLKDIRRVLTDAALKVAAMQTGRIWYGDLTGDINEVTKARMLTSLEEKVTAIDELLRGKWSALKTVELQRFVEDWEAQTLLIARMGYLGIPSLPIPTRGKDEEDSGIVDGSAGEAAGGDPIPPPPPKNGPIDGPVMSD